MNIAIIGGRGNGTVIASTIEDCIKSGKIKVEKICFLNDFEKEINDYPVVGKIRNNDWRKLSDDFQFIYAMSNIKQSKERYDLLLNLEIPTKRFINIFHPSAVVSNKAKIGNGIVVMPHALIGPNVSIEDYALIYGQSFIGHDTKIGKMVFVANNASIGGRVNIKQGAQIGSNASILERVSIGQFAICGLGSVVLNNVNDYETVVGNPARVLGKSNK